MTEALEFSLGAWRIAPSWVAMLMTTAVALVTLQAAWRGWRRLANGGALRRWSVVGLNLLAGGAVVLLLLAPRVEQAASATVTLFTEGAGAPPASSRDDGELARGGQRFSVGAITDLDTAEGPIDRLATPGQLVLRLPDLQSINVLGHGLDEAQWREIPEDLAVHFDPPALSGPVQVQWTPRLVLGQALILSGIVRLEAREAVARLELIDPAGLAVATTSARSGQPFVLTTTPRGPGALEYRLRVLRGDALITDDPVGVFVSTDRGARLLVIQSAPSFETRRLTNWAAESGHALIVHSRISRDRDLSQGVNLEEGAPLARTASLLENLDLVLVDGRRWAELPAGEREMLLDAVRSGLGLVLLADMELAAWLEVPANASLFGLGLDPVPAAEDVWPSWSGFAPEQPLPLAPFRFDLLSARPLTRDETGLLLEAWQPLGKGRVSVSLLRERHRWATSGESSTFARYWARLLRQVAREASGIRWLTPPADARPRPRQRHTLCATQGAASLSFAPRTATAEPATTPLVTPATGARVRCGVVWPTEPGWHVARLFDADGNAQDELLLKVYGGEEWAAHRYAARQVATRARATATSAAPPGQRRVEVPLSPWWAWSLLLFSAGALWLERRLFDLD